MDPARAGVDRHTGRETPAGVFAIIEKDKDHHSTLYDDAWMPNSSRGRGGRQNGLRMIEARKSGRTVPTKNPLPAIPWAYAKSAHDSRAKGDHGVPN